MSTMWSTCSMSTPQAQLGAARIRPTALRCARRTKIASELLPLPHDTAYTLPQWAAYGRYFTAWDNWRVAYDCWRAQLEDEDPADHLVMGWGGGTTLANWSSLAATASASR
jgi:hypothetical protein